MNEIMAQSPFDPSETEQLLGAIANELQQVPDSAPRTSRVAAPVTANNARLARASQTLMRMEDHPDTFGAWCRAFAQRRGDA
jgi:hypothetical protein